MSRSSSLTIAIPAYNESATIGYLLSSLRDQELGPFKLDKILVVLDGCTDNTLSVVKSCKNRQIVVINHLKRAGKVARLNEIFKKNQSDYLVILDADIKLQNCHTIANLCQVMRLDQKAMLVAAHQIPVRSNTFVSRIIWAAYKVWDDTRLSVPSCDHIHNFYGAASVYRGSFAANLVIPASITDERGYLYIAAKKAHGFRYTKKSVIYYRPVSTLHDIWKLGDRTFSKNQVVLSKLYGEKVFEMYNLPVKYKLRAIARNLLRDPFFTTLGLILNVLIRVFPAHDRLYNDGVWEILQSTKSPIGDAT